MNKQRQKLSIFLSPGLARRVKAVAAIRGLWVSQMLESELAKIVETDIKGVEFLTDSNGKEFAVKK